MFGNTIPKMKRNLVVDPRAVGFGGYRVQKMLLRLPDTRTALTKRRVAHRMPQYAQNSSFQTALSRNGPLTKPRAAFPRERIRPSSSQPTSLQTPRKAAGLEIGP